MMIFNSHTGLSLLLRHCSDLLSFPEASGRGLSLSSGCRVPPADMGKNVFEFQL